MRAVLNYVPAGLTLLRAGLAPVILLLAFFYHSRMAFGVCLIVGFFSDVFDGIIARRLNIATANLRRLDTVADSIFYIAAIVAVWLLYPSAILSRRASLAVVIALELTRYVFDWLKFRREAAYHMWSSKLWGVALFCGIFSLLACGADNLLVTAAIYAGIIADVEGLAISFVLREWKNDVPSLFHALKLRAQSF